MTAVASGTGGPVGAEPVLEARGLCKTFRVPGDRYAKAPRSMGLRAVEGIDLRLYERRTLALVGESGSGKSTVARMLARLIAPTSGEVLLDGASVSVRTARQRRRYVGRVQLLFQDPFASLNPAHPIRYQLGRVLRIHHGATGRGEIERRLEHLLTRVQLTPAQQFLDKYPYELSGGQLQRISIARALAASPEVLLLDEPVSMLDVSIRLDVLNLLRTLQQEENLAVLYITHDIASARYFADEMVVMYRGHAVEAGSSESVTQHPAHPYTRLLIGSAPDPQRRPGEVREVLRISPPRPERGNGCRFASRCPHARDVCMTTVPPAVPVADGHMSRCWLDAEQVGEPTA